MAYKLNDKGFALVTTLLLGLVAMALVSLAFYMALLGTQMSGMEKRYSTELNAAKGTADYVMASLRNDNLTCNGGNTCTDDDPAVAGCSAGATIDLDSNVCNALGKTAACTNVTACFLNKTTVDDTDLIAISVTTTNPTTNETTNVDFVYEVE